MGEGDTMLPPVRARRREAPGPASAGPGPGAAPRALALCALLATVLCAGCETDLPKATEIERMRTLGARLEVEGDETRSTPRPGERVRMSIATAFPTLEQDGSEVQAVFIGCTAPDRYTGGIPICQEFIDAVQSGENPLEQLPMGVDLEQSVRCADLPAPFRRASRGALSFQCVSGGAEAAFTVPTNFRADGLLFRGIVCERSSPVIDPLEPSLFRCDDPDAEAIAVHGTIPVLLPGGDANRNPDLDALTLVREGVEWLEYDPDDLPPETGCDSRVDRDDPAVHSIVPGAHEILIRYEADAREEVDGEPEDLEITIYATAGEMERRFTLFPGEDPGTDGVLESELDWEPPKPTELPPGGQLVRFFITLRDQRGGFAMTSRAVCLR